MKNSNYRELKVWQKSIDLVELVFRISSDFPKSELFGLTSQMRRAAVSIPSNIAEGSARKHAADFLRFLAIAEGSGNELETQLIIARRLDFAPNSELQNVLDRLTEVIKMLIGLQKSLRTGN